LSTAAPAASPLATVEPEITAPSLGSMMDYFCHVWLVDGGEADRSSIRDDVGIATMAR
jgi:hypothetical protein